MKIEIIEPDIFPKDIVKAGVTEKNESLFPETGLSFSNAKNLTDAEVYKHQQLLADFIGIPFGNLKFQKQVHGDTIKVIDKESVTEEADGMITNIKGIFPVIKIADCAALLAYDPENKAVGAFHSGWKGTKLNITAKGIRLMNVIYGSDPAKLLFYLSPCASGANYEVEWDVARFFPGSVTDIGNGKYLFDNKKQIKLQLLDAGIDENNIEISDICTIGDKSLHSFRRDKDLSGRMAAYIGMF